MHPCWINYNCFKNNLTDQSNWYRLIINSPRSSYSEVCIIFILFCMHYAHWNNSFSFNSVKSHISLWAVARPLQCFLVLSEICRTQSWDAASVRLDRLGLVLSLTCADDAGRLHVPQESVDAAVVSWVQRVASDPEMEAQPAGLGVKGHGVMGYSDVWSCCRLDVELFCLYGTARLISLFWISLNTRGTFPHRTWNEMSTLSLLSHLPRYVGIISSN